jgi:hypothetical protein
MYEEATVQALAGHTQEALTSLDQALKSGYPLRQVEGDPDLKKVRETPEFAKLVASMGAKPTR